MILYLAKKERETMNYINKEINYSDGTSNIVEITSNDNHQVNLNSNYILANKKIKTNKFKNSILGTDIGINNKGFADIFFLATLISIIAFIIMIFSFRI